MKIPITWVFLQLTAFSIFGSEKWETNCVEIRKGLYFSVTDDFGRGRGTNPMFDSEVKCDSELILVVWTKTTNSMALHAAKGLFPVELNMLNQRLHKTPLTAYGVSNNTSPPLFLRRTPSHFTHLERPYNEKAYLSLCKPSKYFIIPEPGLYLLEARLRTWRSGRGGYSLKLSEPVRVRVKCTHSGHDAQQEFNKRANE
jgi:hypothetical protein